MGREVQKGGDLFLIRVDVWQKSTQYCKTITLQLSKMQNIKKLQMPIGTPRRLLRVPWTARRSNQSILKEISPGCSLEGMMLKLKLQYLPGTLKGFLRVPTGICIF